MIGREISHYLILEKIGEGGMGEIYLAEDLKLGRKVALKFLPPKYTSRKKARERFKREARVAAVLNHPNIVTVHEIEEFGDLIYIVMEYIEGENLAQKFKIDRLDSLADTAPLPVVSRDEIIDVAIEICKGLEVAHQAGIVHRDIKLENILVSNDGGIKILDFGLARLKGASRLTEDSVAMGTAFYMSPEQLRGDDFDHRTDLWSLGVVLYALATGELPFQGKTALDTMQAIVSRDPEPASNINRSIPRGLDQIIKRCLKKNTKDRYQAVGDIIADLRRVRENLNAGETRNQERLMYLTRRIRDYRFRIVASFAILVFMLTLTFMFPGLTRRVKNFMGINSIPESRQMAILPFGIKGLESVENRALYNGLAESITRKLICCEHFEKNLMVVPFRKVLLRKVGTIDEARKDFGVNLVFDVTVSQEKDWYSFALKMYDSRNGLRLNSIEFKKHVSAMADLQTEFIDHIAKMLKLELKEETCRRIKCGITSKSGAYFQYLKAIGYLLDHTRSEFINRAIELLENSIQTNFEFALAYAGLGEAYYIKALLDSPRDMMLLEKAKACCLQAQEREHRMPCVYITLGRIYRKLGDYENSINSFKKVLKFSPNSNKGYRGLARVYEDRGEFEKAGQVYETVARIRKRDAGSFNNLGVFYYKRGDWTNALLAFSKVVELTPEYYRGLLNLGATYYKLEKKDEARIMFERSLKIKPTYSAYSNLGTIYYYQGLYDHAIRMFSGALDIKGNKYLLVGYMAESYYYTQRDMSYPYYSKAAEMVEKELKGQPNNPDMLSDLASYLARLGKHDDAKRLLDRLNKFQDLDPWLMFRIAIVFEHVGERERALEWLEKALDKGYPSSDVRKHPGLDGLPGDSRYLQLLEQSKDKQI